MVTPAGCARGDVGVVDGTIAAVEPDLEGSARETVDATGLHVFPGVVDAHVHCNDPGRSDWEGFAHGTAALAAGGTSTFVDMPLNASPPTVDGASFDLKVAAATEAAVVDFALWGGLVPGDVDRLDELADRASSASRRSCARPGSTTSTRPTTTRCTPGWHVPRASACRWPCTPRAPS